jgi:hypothetical protein
MGDNADLRKHLFDLEARLAAPAARISREEAEELLAQDFFEFGSSGTTVDREKVVSGMAALMARGWSIANFKLTILADDVALVTYIATQSGRGSTNRSSIWKRSDGRWRMAFHQGTRIPE